MQMLGNGALVSGTTVDRLHSMLKTRGAEFEQACGELRELLVRAALAYLLRQGYPISAFGADSYESLAEDFAQDAMVIILQQIDSFRGESRFTTWAYRIVVNLLADEYRRRAWRHRPLDPELDTVLPSWHGPQKTAERREIWSLVAAVIEHDLTPRQRQVLVARVVHEKPLVVIADELGTNKDNVYKLLHDARRHLRRALAERGVSEVDALAAFDDA
jgi:RNA polymerase sigma-70 factor (ECF subfamily)